MPHLLTPYDHDLIHSLWQADTRTHPDASLCTHLESIESVVLRHLQARLHVKTLSPLRLSSYREQILHAVAAHAILAGVGVDSTWGRVIQVLYHHGGGYAALLDHGRLCICTPLEPQPRTRRSVRHTTRCERLWRIYRSAVSTLFPPTPAQALEANRLCILDTTGFKGEEAEQALQALVAAHLAVSPDALRQAWWTVEMSCFDQEDELPCLQQYLRTQQRVLAQQQTVLILRETDAMLLMPLALALLEQTGIAPLLVRVQGNPTEGWSLPLVPSGKL